MALPARVTVFDLDDTLYPELAFARSGLRAVGEYLTRTYGVARAVERLLAGLEAGVRHRNFDPLVSELGKSAGPDLGAQLVQLYRGHHPVLSLESESAEALRLARRLGALALITDGPARMQRNKVASLGIESDFDLLVFSDELGSSKPDPRVFAPVTDRWPQARCCYIADNGEKDFVTPNRLGWTTIRVAREDAMYARTPPSGEYRPQIIVRSVERAVHHWSQIP